MSTAQRVQIKFIAFNVFIVSLSSEKFDRFITDKAIPYCILSDQDSFPFACHLNHELLQTVPLTFFLKNGPFATSFFLYFRLFYKQLTVNKCSIKVADDWIRTRVLWDCKRPLCQLRHNHFPIISIFYQYTVNCIEKPKIQYLKWPRIAQI